jgi:hypothetical protein
MSRLGLRIGGLLLLAALCGGCASTREGAVDPALFPRAAVASDSRVAGRVAVLVPPQVRSLVHDPMREMRIDMRLPVGRIVEQAVLTAASDAMRGGAQGVDAPPRPGSGFDVTLVVDAVRLRYDRRLRWLAPMPPPLFVIGDSEVEARLAFDLTMLDAQGRKVWSRSYDSGSEIVKRPSAWRGETPEALMALAHESAWRLSQQVVNDLRDWLAAERNKAREL